MVGLLDGKNEDMFSGANRKPACDGRPDRRTDRRSSCDRIVRAMHTRRAIKMSSKTI